MKIFGKLLLNLFLVIIAVTLLYFLLIPSIVIMLFVSFFKTKIGDGFNNVSHYLRKVAISVDQLGNVVASSLLNVTLITYDGYKFGNPDETISGVLGKNEIVREVVNFGTLDVLDYPIYETKNTLTWLGLGVNWILSKIESNHSINSIESDENNNVNG